MNTGFTADELKQLTRQSLYDLAQKLNIKGRSKLSKDQLIEVLAKTAATPDKKPQSETKAPKIAKPAKVAEPKKSNKTPKIATTDKPAKTAKPAKTSKPPKKENPPVSPVAKKARSAKPAPEKAAAEESLKPKAAKKKAVAKSVSKTNKIETPHLPAIKTQLPESVSKSAQAAPVEPSGKKNGAKRLDRMFGKKTENVPAPRNRKGAEVIDQPVAIPFKPLGVADNEKTSKKAEQIEKDRRKKHASLKTTMEIPIFSQPEHDFSIPVSEDELTGDLPVEYGEKRIVMQIRDPHWAYAYWELPQIEMKRLELEVGIFEFAHSHFVLRLHDVSHGYSQEIKLSEHARNWYLYLEDAQTVYQVELGMHSPTEGYTFIALSNLVQTPPDQVAERWADPVLPTPKTKDHAEDTPPVSDNSLPPFVPTPGIVRLTDPKAVYSSSLSGEPLPRSGSSELLAGQNPLKPELAPPAINRPAIAEVSSFGLPASQHLYLPASHVAAAFMPSSSLPTSADRPFSQSVSSPEKPFGETENLFICAAADIIIYGKVAAGSLLTFMGEPVNVRPDGSYSLRLALPFNAEREIELVATDPFTGKTRVIKAKINLGNS